MFYNSSGKAQAVELLNELAAQEKQRHEDNRAKKPPGHAQLLAAIIQEHWQRNPEWPEFREQCARKRWFVLGRPAVDGPGG